MISFDFTHRDENGKEETFANDSRDLFVWESTDKQGRAFLEPFSQGVPPRMVDLYRLAWIAARRIGLIEKKVTFDTYAEDYTIKVDMEETVIDADPTQEAASAGG